MGAIPTKGKSARQHVPKFAAAAKGLGGVPTATEGAGERPCVASLSLTPL